MSGSTAVAKTSQDGEVLPAKFEMGSYLKGIRGSRGIDEQKGLMAAYDEACAGLVGPNDVQVEGKRTFKKKSAWRKLARHFGISSSIRRIEREILSSGHFLATVVARAEAPWGQVYEEVGACCTDEETGRRKITVADAIATASTRATNRAISNLIAMGEVSAEEIGDRSGKAVRAVDPTRLPGKPESWGGNGGKLLTDVASVNVLMSARDWMTREPEREQYHAKLIEAIDQELDRRRAEPQPAKAEGQTSAPEPAAAAAPAEVGTVDVGMPAAIDEEEDDDLPF